MGQRSDGGAKDIYTHIETVGYDLLIHAAQTAGARGGGHAPISAFAADKIVMAVGGMEEQIHLPAKLAEQLGYFKEQDLDVEMINTRAGDEAENVLISDEG
jgi:ABC-type nitrate/sulfonate/bicarbonate transport system substrate-binding protein